MRARSGLLSRVTDNARPNRAGAAVPGHALGLSLVSGVGGTGLVPGAGGAGLMAWFALVAFSGLLRPLQRSARLQPPRRARPDETVAPTMRLNAIELGLI